MISRENVPNATIWIFAIFLPLNFFLHTNVIRCVCVCVHAYEFENVLHWDYVTSSTTEWTIPQRHHNSATKTIEKKKKDEKKESKQWNWDEME